MYRLCVKNFKCFSDYTIDINSDSLFLLDGQSGVGKSSLIQAFVFVVTGEGKKLYKQGFKTLTVSLEFKNKKENYKIIRKKGPESLMLHMNKDVYEDDEAQTRINKIFGYNFNMTSIIKQKGEASFLLSSPKDKMIFLQNLLFSDTNIEDNKKKIKQKLKEYKDRCAVLEGQKQIFVKMLQTSRKSFDDCIINRTESIDCCNEKIQQNIAYIEKINGKKTKLLSKINICTDEKIKLMSSIDMLGKRMIKLLSVEEKLTAIIKEIRHQQDCLKNIPEIEEIEKKLKDNKIELSLVKLKNKIQDTKKILLDKIKQDNELVTKKLNQLADEFNVNREKNIDNYDRLLEKKDLIKKYNDVKKNIEKLNIDEDDIELVKTKQELCKTFLNAALMYKTSFKCPHCKTFVRMNNNVLEKIEEKYETDDYSDENVARKKRELKDLTEKIENMITTKKLYKHYEGELKALEGKIEKYNDLSPSTIKEINQQIADIDEWKEKQREKEDLQRKLRQLEKEKHTIDDNSHKSFVEDYKNFIELSKKIKEPRNEKQLDEERTNLIINQKEYEKINDKLDELKRQKKEFQTLCEQEKKEDLEQKINQYQDGIQEKDHDIQNLEIEYKVYKDLNFEKEEQENIELRERIKYVEYKQECDKLENERKQVEDEFKTFEKNSIRCSTILAGIDYAESKMLSKFIDTINHNLSIHLDAFFTEPITVLIKAFKENDKPLINLEIYYKGNETELSNLSGGEYDRLNLALILTFNYLSQSRVLILDESLSSINQELSTEIIMHLKENKANKLIWMTQHQAVKGMFDNVFELKSL